MPSDSLKVLLTFISILPWFSSTESQLCPASGIQAGIDTVYRNFDANNSRYLLNGKGVINCYGVVKEWIFHTRDRCNSTGANIIFEIWRPTAAIGTYQLVGGNTFTASDCGMQTNSVTFRIPPIKQIPVEPGYIIGWYQQGNVRISYDSPGVNPLTYSTTTSGAVTPGVTADFINSSQIDFSLKVTVIQGSYTSIDNLPATVSWPENEISLPLVFSVIASNICNNPYPDAVPLSFTLSPSTTLFTILNSTGVNGIADIMAGPVIDYEQQSVYLLSVTVTGLGLRTTEILTVNVLDVNEIHNISNLPGTITVPASSCMTGDEVFAVAINDPDVNPVVPVSFYLQNWYSDNTNKDNPPFFMNPNTGSVTASTDLSNWYLQYPLNSPPYPSDIVYILTILTTDGTFQITGNLSINITGVKQPPIFLNLPSNVTIDETSPPKTVVYQVLVAASPDPITFEITDSPTPFCIDRYSGIVSLCSYANLDACKQNQYSIKINATNSALSSFDLLNISVQWINSAPSFDQTTYVATINEKCDNVFEFQVAILDRDLNCSPRDTHTCQIVPGSGSQFFTITNCTTVTNTPTCIDLDKFPEYETIVLLLQVTDAGNLVSYSQAIVNVVNINDYNPVFNETFYHGSVQENSPGGTSVLTVSASDGDSGLNGEFYYFIPSTDPNFLLFEVEPNSGVVKTKQPLDYESGHSYVVIVYARDKGSPSLNGSTNVTIDILNANDNRPMIICTDRPSDEPYPSQPCFYNFDLIHDAAIGHTVSFLKFSATDVDSSKSLITFNLLVPDNYFDLNTNTGLISVKHPVEEYKKYLLYVYANDNGDPSLWSRIMNVRIDTYRRDRQYIDLTVRPAIQPFDDDAFLAALRNVTSPWFMKNASKTSFDPTVQTDFIVTVYALADISSYDPSNIDKQKIFVDRDDMLSRLRRNIYGDPEDILKNPMFEDFPVIKVMPTYVNWWLDTVEGIATIVCLSVLGLLFLIFAILGVCKGFGLLCFKKKVPVKPFHAWVENEPSTGKSIDQDSVRHRSAHGRRESVTTVHSVILGRDF